MADGPVTLCPPASAMLASLQIKRDYLTQMSDFVFRYKHKTFTLESPAGAIMKIGDLEDTIYRGKHDEVNGWGKFFLPEIVRMQVVGVVKGTSCPCDQLVLMTSCPCDQLVLMTCEDRKMYAYDGEELHEVASSFEQLCAEGIEYPASRSYYEGEAFKHMSKKDWGEVKKGDVGKSLDHAHHKLVTAEKSKFLQSLKSK